MIQNGSGLVASVPKVLLALFVVGLGTVARAQDPVVVEEPALNAFVLNESNFNQWIFGNMRRTIPEREYFALLLGFRVAEVERSCSLTEAQKRKLVLAGQGDVKRFTDRLADARSVFERLRTDQNRINEIMQETQPLGVSLSKGLFGEGSFFVKTLAKTLDPDQAARYREVIREKRLFQYKAKVSLALAKFDNAVGFTTEQYHRFAAVVLEEITPAEKPAGPQEANLIRFNIARIPEEKLRPIFDAARWQTLKQQFQEARSLEPMLRSSGLLDPVRPANKPEAARIAP